jgi:hypothetical protein
MLIVVYLQTLVVSETTRRRNDSMKLNNKLEMMWMEVVVA